MTQELVLTDQTYMPAMSIGQAAARFNTLVEFVQTVMRPDVDYGVIPGTPKPTLLKPGAEKLTTLFGLTTRFVVVEKVEDWTGENHGSEPFFYYWYRCQLWRGERLIAEADGSCNSREGKYRWRWVQAQDIPEGMSAAKLTKRGGSTSEFDFAIEKAETSGQYGKPAEYWQAFRDAINNGTARQIKRKTKAGKEMAAWEIDATMYRIPNDNICDQVNTFQKMAQKRALIAATLIGVNASEFFTQDVEDIQTVGNGASYVPPVQVLDTKTGEILNPAQQNPRRAAILVRLHALAQEAEELGLNVPDMDKATDKTDAELVAAGTAFRAKLDAYKRGQSKPQHDTDNDLIGADDLFPDE